jgi:hypothetical protein
MQMRTSSGCRCHELSNGAGPVEKLVCGPVAGRAGMGGYAGSRESGDTTLCMGQPARASRFIYAWCLYSNHQRSSMAGLWGVPMSAALLAPQTAALHLSF